MPIDNLGPMRDILLRGRAAMREQFGPGVNTRQIDTLLGESLQDDVGEGDGQEQAAQAQERTEQVEQPEQPVQAIPLSSSAEQPQSQPPPAPEPPKPSRDEELAKAVQRYETLRGKYEAETGGMRAELAKTRQEMATLREQVRSVAVERDTALKSLREMEEQLRRKPWEDVSELGQDTVEAIKRGARAEAESLISELRGQVTSLKAQLEALKPTVDYTSTRTMEMTLDGLVPGWREVNVDPEFVSRWLKEQDPLSGYVREQLLADAMYAGDTARIARLFKAYMAETGKGRTVEPERPAKAAEPRQEERPSLMDMAVPEPGASVQTTKSQDKPLTRADLVSIQQIITDPRRTYAEKVAARERMKNALRSGRLNL